MWFGSRSACWYRDHNNYYRNCVCLNLSHVNITKHAQQDRQNRYFAHHLSCSTTFNAIMLYIAYYNTTQKNKLGTIQKEVFQCTHHVIVVTQARVPHGIYWLSSDVGPRAAGLEDKRHTSAILPVSRYWHSLNCAICQILAHCFLWSQRSKCSLFPGRAAMTHAYRGVDIWLMIIHDVMLYWYNLCG